MPAFIQRMNQASGSAVVSTTDVAGVIGKIGFDFGFLASSVSVFNDKATPVYVSFDTTAGSTGGYPIAATSFVEFLGCLQTGIFSLASTATSTDTSARYVALGG